MTHRLLALVVLLLALAGCGGTTSVTPPADPTAAPSVTAQDPTAAPSATAPALPAAPASAPPARVEVPAIEAASTLIATGITDGILDTPPVAQPEQASWWDGSPAPGEIGPAVLLGHVDGAGRPGVFVDLDQVEAGDDVFVDDHRFEVYRVAQHDKDAFPTLDVYGDTAVPELRLITCGGTFDQGAESYEDNVIVFARIVGP